MRRTPLAVLVLVACIEHEFVGPETTVVPPETEPVIRLEPPSHDFGALGPGCPATQTFTIFNDGTADLVVDTLALEAGTAELVLDNPNALPLELWAGHSAPLAVTYRPIDGADDYARIVATSNDPVTPEAAADLHGDGATDGPTVDTFEQPADPQTDFLVVVDNSISMTAEQDGLTSNFQTFIDAVVAAGADYRLAVITTDDPSFRGPVIDRTLADPVAEFTAQALVGTDGAPDERPMEMMFSATDVGGDAAPGGAFLRDDALLAAIVVTDEPDDFSPMTPQQLFDHLVGVKSGDPTKVRVHTIGGDIPDPPCPAAANASTPLDQLSAISKSLFLSVCSPWGTSLQQIAEESVTPLDRFTLSGTPLLETLGVTVDGAVATGWSYDAATNSIAFDAASVPVQGASVVATYEQAGVCGG